MAATVESHPVSQKVAPIVAATDRLISEDRNDHDAERSSPASAKDAPQERFYSVFFRTIGLAVLNYLLGLLGHRRFQEPSKVILRRSWTIVLLRNVVHLIPVGGAITIVYLNIAGMYLGDTFNSIAALQFAAKLHEIFMVASLSQIVLHLVRSELISGDGLPFGALVSGLQFYQLSYLWSLEFWGLVTSPSFSWWRKTRFAILAVVCVILAASVGPSSAIAMIPRVGYWPAGVTSIWLNGTNDQVFPQTISTDGIPPSCINSSSVLGEPVCPSTGWQSIAGLVPFEQGSIGPATSNWGNVSRLLDQEIGFPSSIQLPGREALRTLYFCTELEDQCAETLATTQYSALADAVELSGRFWIDGILNVPNDRLQQYNTALLTVESSQPFVAVYCHEGGAIQGPGDQTPIRFPDRFLSSDPESFDRQSSIVNVTTASIPEIFQTSEDPTNPRLVFVDLPPLSSNEATLGALILDARDPRNTTQIYTSCLVGAGWGFSQVNTTLPKAEAQTPVDESALETPVTGTGFQGPFLENLGINVLSQEYYFSDFPLRRISLSKEWAQYTNSFIPSLNASAFSAINAPIGNDPLRYRPYGEDYAGPFDSLAYLREMVLASLIANGLSNLGLNFTMQGNLTLAYFKNKTDQQDEQYVDGSQWILHNKDIFTLDPGDESANWAKFQVQSYINGYSYNSSGLLVRIALALLLTYCLLASTFVLYTSVRGISSSAWDSISELTALAMTSPPPAAELKNTCGGIASLNTYKLMASVVVRRSDDDEDEGRDDRKEKGETSGRETTTTEQVQLVFRRGKRTPAAAAAAAAATGRVELSRRYWACSSPSSTRL